MLATTIAAVPAAAAPFQVTLGDSWSVGVGASTPEKGYAPVLWHKLQKRFDCPPVDATGAPRSGSETSRSEERRRRAWSPVSTRMRFRSSDRATTIAAGETTSGSSR